MAAGEKTMVFSKNRPWTAFQNPSPSEGWEPLRSLTQGIFRMCTLFEQGLARPCSKSVCLRFPFGPRAGTDSLRLAAGMVLDHGWRGRGGRADSRCWLLRDAAGMRSSPSARPYRGDHIPSIPAPPYASLGGWTSGDSTNLHEFIEAKTQKIFVIVRGIRVKSTSAPGTDRRLCQQILNRHKKSVTTAQS